MLPRWGEGEVVNGRRGGREAEGPIRGFLEGVRAQDAEWAGRAFQGEWLALVQVHTAEAAAGKLQGIWGGWVKSGCRRGEGAASGAPTSPVEVVAVTSPAVFWGPVLLARSSVACIMGKLPLSCEAHDSTVPSVATGDSASIDKSDWALTGRAASQGFCSASWPAAISVGFNRRVTWSDLHFRTTALVAVWRWNEGGGGRRWKPVKGVVGRGKYGTDQRFRREGGQAVGVHLLGW